MITPTATAILALDPKASRATRGNYRSFRPPRRLQAVVPVSTKGGRAALEQQFSGTAGWSTATSRLLYEAGFNTTGAWSDHDALSRAWTPDHEQIAMWAREAKKPFNDRVYGIIAWLDASKTSPTR